MDYIINGVFCLTLALAIYNTMVFIVDCVNATIDGIENGEGYIDNRHFILGWSLVLLTYFIKSVTL